MLPTHQNKFSDSRNLISNLLITLQLILAKFKLIEKNIFGLFARSLWFRKHSVDEFEKNLTQIGSRISIEAKTDFQVIFAGWTQAVAGYIRSALSGSGKQNQIGCEISECVCARSPAAISRVWISYEASCWFNSSAHHRAKASAS